MGDKIIIDKDDLIRIADTIRLQTGSEELLSLNDMHASLEDTLYIIVDEAGNQLNATFTEQAVIADATANDIRIGKTAITESGLITGTKEIPVYYSNYGYKLLSANKEATLFLPRYNYKNLLVTISTYNTSREQSLNVTYISIDNGMYAIGNNTKLSDITIDEEKQQIKFGITVNEKSILRYFVITEEI